MKKIGNWKGIAYLVLSVFTLALLASCAGQSTNQGTAGASGDTGKKERDQSLAMAYSKIAVMPVSISAALAKDYPDAARECQASAVSSFQEKKKFLSIEMAAAAPAPAAGTLVVKISVTDMRVVSGGARFWAGAMAGSSYMNLDVTLTDGATMQEVRKKQLSSTNNAFAAAWTMGSNDRSLPMDMGKMVAEYVDSIMPGK